MSTVCIPFCHPPLPHCRCPVASVQNRQYDSLPNILFYFLNSKLPTVLDLRFTRKFIFSFKPKVSCCKMFFEPSSKRWFTLDGLLLPSGPLLLSWPPAQILRFPETIKWCWNGLKLSGGGHNFILKMFLRNMQYVRTMMKFDGSCIMRKCTILRKPSCLFQHYLVVFIG